MPLAVLSDAELDVVRRELTAAPRKSDYSPVPEAPYALYTETAGAISVPRAYGVERWGLPANDVSDDGVVLDPERCRFEGELRTTPPQVEAVDRLCRELCPDPPRAAQALLEFPCGYGKTTCAAAVISRVMRRTLVVVGRTCLLSQWKERLAHFLPGLRVGLMQGSRSPSGDEDVVVAMLQTLASRKPDLKGYGLMVLDEAHHVAARTWAQVQRRLRCRRRLSLTATLRRGDGLGCALDNLLGSVTFSATRPPDDSVVAWCVGVPPNGRKEILIRGRVAMAQMINQLAEDPIRIAAIAKVTTRAREAGHHVIVLSDRIQQLERLADMLRGDHGCECALLTGATKSAERDSALKTGIVLASYGLAAEGLDEPSLSALIMATPRGDVEQAVGRVLRKHPGKLPPVVVDFADKYSAFCNQANGRRRQYKRFGYDVRDAAEAEVNFSPPARQPRQLPMSHFLVPTTETVVT